MKSDAKKRIPVNLISGPLGAGKTTAINHLLAHRPHGERWAVLINEYGLVGLDAALISGESRGPEVAVREVAGGCICCSASFMFDVSLVLLLQRRPDRLLIEPTGLATVSGILDTLARRGIREAVDVRSVIALLDPARLHKDLERPEVKDQIDAADVLLANRTDLAGVDNLRAFDDWSRDIFPPKRFVGRTERGRIEMHLLDLVADRSANEASDRAEPGHHHHEHAHGTKALDSPHSSDPGEEVRCDQTTPIVQRVHRSPVASTIGWIVYKDLTFDADRVAAWLHTLSAEPGVRRVKAVVRTEDGWTGFNLTEDVAQTGPTGHRRDSRLELVVERDPPPDVNELEQSLRACLVSPPPTVQNRPPGADPSVAEPQRQP